MANSTVHGTLIKYEKDGTETNQITIYPKNTAQDVAVTQAGHVPQSVTNMQELIAALGSLAFSGSISGLDTSVFAEGVITTDLTITAEGKIADARALKTLNDKITKNAEDITKLNSNTIEYTLLNSNWIGENTPYSYTISLGDTYTLTNNSKVDIGASLSCSDTQLESLMALSLCGGSIDTESNSITLKAFGEKPSIDIPISILIREEIVHE